MIWTKLEVNTEGYENKDKILTQSGAEQKGEGKMEGTFPREQICGTESQHIMSASASIYGTSFCLSSLPCSLLVVLPNSLVSLLGGSLSLKLSEFGWNPSTLLDCFWHSLPLWEMEYAWSLIHFMKSSIASTISRFLSV